MAAILPGFSRESVEFTKAQVVIYALERYMLIGLHIFLLFLVVLNIWTILIKQRRYKTLPILAFYILSFLTIACRLVWLILEYNRHENVI